MKKWFKSLSIHSILLISFMPLILLILLTYCFFYQAGSSQLKNQTYESANNINATISSSLGQSLNNVYQVASTITSDRVFFQLKQNLRQNHSPAISPSEYLSLYNLIDGLFTANQNYFRSISLYLDNSFIFVYCDNGQDPIPKADFQYEDYANSVSSSQLSWILPRELPPYQTASHNHSALGLMMLLGTEDSDIRGFLLFELRDELLLGEIQNAIVTPNSRFAITCDNQLLLSDNLLWTEDISEKLQNYPSQFYTSNNYYFYKSVTFSTGDANLGILSQIPQEDVSLNQRSLIEPLIIIIVLFLSFCALTYYVIHCTVSRPLIQLNNVLTKPYDIMSSEEFNISGSREVQTINAALNDFLWRIRALIQNLNHETNERQIAELNILYEQINPHFLYNALDTIYQLCDMGETQNAKEMTHSLATFYRIGVSKGTNYITLEDECTHAQVYLSILKIRFADFTYSIHLPEDLKHCITIKKILQPILENAIYHGIHPLYDRTGHVSICVSRQGDDIQITIADNGIGILEHDLAHIRKSLNEDFHPTKKGKIYGIKNVHARIHLTYHHHYGLTIDSTPEVGTTVTITIPVITKPQEGENLFDESTVC